MSASPNESDLLKMLEMPISNDKESQRLKQSMQVFIKSIEGDFADRDSFLRHVENIKNILEKLLSSAEVFSRDMQCIVWPLLKVLENFRDEAIDDILKSYENISVFLEEVEPQYRRIFSGIFNLTRLSIIEAANSQQNIWVCLNYIPREYKLQTNDTSILNQRYVRIRLISELIELKNSEGLNENGRATIDTAIARLVDWGNFQQVFRIATSSLPISKAQSSVGTVIPHGEEQKIKIDQEEFGLIPGGDHDGSNLSEIPAEDAVVEGDEDEEFEITGGKGNLRDAVEPSLDVEHAQDPHAQSENELSPSFGADCLRFVQDHKIALGIASAVVLTAVLLGVGVIPGGPLILAAAAIAGAAIASHAGICIGVGVPALTLMGCLTFFSNRDFKNAALDEQALYYLGAF